MEADSSFIFRFVSVENDEEIANVLESKRWPSVLGPERFIEWVKGKHYAAKAGEDVPQTKDLAPKVNLIIHVVCEFYNVSRDELYRSIRGQFNEPRNVREELQDRYLQEAPTWCTWIHAVENDIHPRTRCQYLFGQQVA
jgi:hypothetical protein